MHPDDPRALPDALPDALLRDSDAQETAEWREAYLALLRPHGS